MRLKTFTAASMAEAMKMVKDHFGEDAIIVSSQKADGGNGVRVTAAIDESEDDFQFEDEIADPIDPVEAISEALAHHGVPPQMSEKLLRIVDGLEVDDPQVSLAGAIDQSLKFSALPKGLGAGPLMLVGMPGAGKTVTIAKLATQAVMRGDPVSVITTDTVRAGGFAQLEAFTRILKVDLVSAANADALQDAILACGRDRQILIDCAGGNPFDDDDFDKQYRLIRASGAEVVLVMAAGGDPMESGEIAEIYGEMGARRIVMTRLDVARRLGGLLAAATAGRLSIAEVGIGPNVADGLRALNPVSLARLLLPESAAAERPEPQRMRRGAVA